MDERAEKIMEKYYKKYPDLHRVLLWHSNAVASKALRIAENYDGFDFDLQLIKEGALLHDIGVFLTDAPEINCFGENPYLCHGYLGREILEKEGLPKHALIAERHIGSGIGEEEIRKKNLPLPPRDMLPLTPEEEVICLADKFYNKSDNPLKEKQVEDIKNELKKHGPESAGRMEKLLRKYV